MKKYNIRYFALLFLFVFAGTACSDYLDENSISYQTTDSYYVDEDGFESLVNSCYSPLHDIINTRELIFFGTDMFTSKAWNLADEGYTGSALNCYNSSFNADNGSVYSLWATLYEEVAICNTAISRSEDIEGMDEDLLAIRVAEAKVLRALSFFYLVQQYGDIPMPLEETTTASHEVTRIESSVVYEQIISDLEECEAILPSQDDTDYGRVSQGLAQFLLAKVYLTRGWNYNGALGGSDSDFDKAVEYADMVIADYPLESEYKNLFPLHNENPLWETFPDQVDKNDEIIFAVQYSDNILTYDGGNYYHSLFGSGAEDIPGSLGRTSDYNRHGGTGNYIVTPAMYRLFDPDLDVRYEHYFVDAMYALSDVSNFVPDSNDPDVTIEFTTGDTVVFFPPWNQSLSDEEHGMDVGGTSKYAVYNTNEIGILDGTNYCDAYKTPLMWKFWQPGIDYDDAMGTCDYVLFRSAEAYLIAAEAILKGASNGDLGDAEVYYNTVVDRALGDNAGAEPMCAETPEDLDDMTAVSYRANGNLDIEMIMDERARELLAEYTRWYDLKRTQTLIDRTTRMNPWTAAIGEMEEYHYLRPIPQDEIDSSIPSIEQNEGY